MRKAVSILPLLGILSAFSLLLPFPSFAVIQSLEGQTGQNQTFADDSNIGISSASNVHTLQWLGLLPISRGGTGASSFTNGSIPFISGGVFSEDNANLFWDPTNNRMGINTDTPQGSLHIPNGKLIVGGPEYTSPVPDDLGVDILGGSFGNFSIAGRTGDEENNGGTQVSIDGGAGGLGVGNGGPVAITSGNGGLEGGSAGEVLISAGATFNGNGGHVRLFGGTGGNSGDGGIVSIVAGDGEVGGDISLNAGESANGTGASIRLRASTAQGVGDFNGGDMTFTVGDLTGNGRSGQFKFYPKDQEIVSGILDFDSIAGSGPDSDKTFTFPNFSGTLSLLERDQIYSGLNRFEASSNSTVYVGSSTKSGCIAMGDSDGDGVTYITVNDGVMSASATKPSICQ